MTGPWRNLVSTPFWQQIPAWADVDEELFLEHKWQEKNSITTPKKLIATLQDLVSQEFIDDVSVGFQRPPMAVESLPICWDWYWNNPYDDPIRRQFRRWVPSWRPTTRC